MTNKVTRTSLVTERASDYANNANILAKDGSVNSAPGDKEISGHNLQGNIAEALDRAKAYFRVNHGTPVDDVFYYTWKIPYTNYCRTAAGVDCGEFSDAVANGQSSTATGWTGVGSLYTNIQNDGYLSSKCLRFQFQATEFGGNFVTMVATFTTPADPTGGQVKLRVKRTQTILDSASLGGGYTELKLVVLDNSSTTVKTFTIFKHNVPQATAETDLGHTDWYNAAAEVAFSIGDLSASTQYKLRFIWTKNNGTNNPLIQSDAPIRDVDNIRIHFPTGETRLIDDDGDIEPTLDNALVVDIRDSGAPNSGGALVDRFFNIRDIHDPAVTGAGSANTAWTDSSIWDEGWDPDGANNPSGWAVTEPAGAIVEVLNGDLHLKVEDTTSLASTNKDVGHFPPRGITIEFHLRIVQHNVTVDPSGFNVLVNDGLTRNGLYITPTDISYSQAGITAHLATTPTTIGVDYVFRVIVVSSGGAAASTIIVYRRREDDTTWTRIGRANDAGGTDATTADGTITIRQWANTHEASEAICKYITVVRGRYPPFAALPDWSQFQRARLACLRKVVTTQDATTFDIDTLGFELKWTVPPVHPSRAVAEAQAQRIATRRTLETRTLADAPISRTPHRLRREDLTLAFQALRLPTRITAAVRALDDQAERTATRRATEVRTLTEAVEPRTLWRPRAIERTILEEDLRELTRLRQEQRTASDATARTTTRNREEAHAVADAVEPRTLWRPRRETRTLTDLGERSVWRQGASEVRALALQVLRTFTPQHAPAATRTTTDNLEPKTLWRPGSAARSVDDGDKRIHTRIREEARAMVVFAERIYTPRYLPTVARGIADIIEPRIHYRPSAERRSLGDFVDNRTLHRTAGTSRTVLDDDRRTVARVRDEARTLGAEALLRTFTRLRESHRPLADMRERILHRLTSAVRAVTDTSERTVAPGPRTAIRTSQDDDRRTIAQVALARRTLAETEATRIAHRLVQASRTLEGVAARSAFRIRSEARASDHELTSRALTRMQSVTRALLLIAERTLLRFPSQLARSLTEEPARRTMHRPKAAYRALDDEDRRVLLRLRTETRSLGDQVRKTITTRRVESRSLAEEPTSRRAYHRSTEQRSLTPDNAARRFTRRRLTDRSLRDEDKRTIYEIGLETRILAAEARRAFASRQVTLATRDLADQAPIRSVHRARQDQRTLEAQLLRALARAKAEARRMEEISSTRRTNVDWTTLLDRLDDVLYFYNLWATQLYGPSLIEFLDAIDVETR